MEKSINIAFIILTVCIHTQFHAALKEYQQLAKLIQSAERYETYKRKNIIASLLHKIPDENSLREYSKKVATNKTKLPNLIDTYCTIIDFCTDSAIIGEHNEILKEGVDYFYNTPGFKYVLSAVLKNKECNDNVKGPLYEIQRAVAIKNAYPELTLIGFNIARTGAGKSREFDLVFKNTETNEEWWIECKNSNFSDVKNAIHHKKKLYKKKLCQQITDQKEIVDYHHKEYGLNVSFQVSSGEPFPEMLETWLNNNEIPYYVGVEEVFYDPS